MDRTERFHLIDQMLCNQRVVTRTQFLEALEVSPATFKRDLEYLRDRLAAPIIWDAELRGYRYESGAALDQFQDEKLRIRKELRDVRHQLDKDIEQLGSLLKVMNILVMPLLLTGLLLGIRVLGLARTGNRS